jgi:hypothetical protein
MQLGLTLVATLLCAVAVWGQEAKDQTPAKRHGVEADLKTYPQGSAKDAFASVLKAIENKRIDYLLAHLADPDWVDRRVKTNGGGFAEVVYETKGKLLGDPGAIKRLTRLFKDGEWQVANGTASVHSKDGKDEGVFFQMVNGRWFMENRKK